MLKSLMLPEEKWLQVLEGLQILAASAKLCPNYSPSRLQQPKLSGVFTSGDHLGIIGRGHLVGVVVLTGCNLRCKGCLYYQWSIEQKGVLKDTSQLAKIFLRLKELGRSRIVIMDANHLADFVVDAIKEAVSQGLDLPLVWWTSGYDYVETIALLSEIFDIFVVDLKTVDKGFAELYLGAKDYAERAKEVLLWLDSYLGPYDEDRGSGYVLRHLYIPGAEKQTEAVLKWVAKSLGTNTYVEIVSSFVPSYQSRQLGFSRRTGPEDIAKVMAIYQRLGLTNVHLV